MSYANCAALRDQRTGLLHLVASFTPGDTFQMYCGVTYRDAPLLFLPEKIKGGVRVWCEFCGLAFQRELSKFDELAPAADRPTKPPPHHRLLRALLYRVLGEAAALGMSDDGLVIELRAVACDHEQARVCDCSYADGHLVVERTCPEHGDLRVHFGACR